MGLLRFVKQAVQHPRQVSTLLPSSSHLARAMANQIDLSRARSVVEVGAGDGALTDPLVERLGPNSNLYLIEINPAFCEQLRNQYRDHPKWNRIRVLKEDAQNLPAIVRSEEIRDVDAVVSGLPLTSLPNPLSDRILRGIHTILEPGGTYVQFTYWTMTLFNDYREDMEQVFPPPDRHLVWRNILPTVIYSASKSNRETHTY